MKKMTKIISEITEKKIEHQGDLEITCDIPNGTHIIVTDGLLKISGVRVGDHAVLKTKTKQQAQSFNNVAGGRNIVIINGVVVGGDNIGRSGQSKDCSINISSQIGENVTINSANSIIINNAGDSLSASSGNEFSALNIGSHANINAGNGITVSSVGDNSTLDAGNSITAEIVGKDCTLDAGNGITAHKVDKNTTLDAGNSIRVTKKIGSGCSLDAGNSIKIPSDTPCDVTLDAGNKVIRGEESIKDKIKKIKKDKFKF